MREISDRLLATVTGWLDAILNAVPKAVVAIVLLVVAVFIARLARRMLTVTLQKLHVDDLMQKAGLDVALRRIGVQKLSEALPVVVYVLLLVVFAGAASDALGLTGVSAAIGAVLGYLPNVAAAVLLLVFGAWAAQAAGKAAATAAEGTGLEFGPSLGRLVSSAIFFVVALTAASQLKIDTDVIRIFTMCGLAGLALAFGLSMGLGSRSVMKNILTGFYARKLFRAGDRVRIGETEGVLVGITSTQALVERGEDTVVLPNTVFLEEAITLRAKVRTSIPAEVSPPAVDDQSST